MTAYPDRRPRAVPRTLAVVGLAVGAGCLALRAPLTAEEGQKIERWLPKDRSDFTKIREEGFPLNVAPTTVAASDAQLEDDDIVIGAVVRGEARAWPVNYMNGPHHEVVNDQLGGLPVAPTW